MDFKVLKNLWGPCPHIINQRVMGTPSNWRKKDKKKWGRKNLVTQRGEDRRYRRSVEKQRFPYPMEGQNAITRGATYMASESLALICVS